MFRSAVLKIQLHPRCHDFTTSIGASFRQVDRKQLPADWRKRLRLIQAKAAELTAPDQVPTLDLSADDPHSWQRRLKIHHHSSLWSASEISSLVRLSTSGRNRRRSLGLLHCAGTTGPPGQHRRAQHAGPAEGHRRIVAATRVSIRERRRVGRSHSPSQTSASEHSSAAVTVPPESQITIMTHTSGSVSRCCATSKAASATLQ